MKEMLVTNRRMRKKRDWVDYRRRRVINKGWWIDKKIVLRIVIRLRKKRNRNMISC